MEFPVIHGDVRTGSIPAAQDKIKFPDQRMDLPTLIIQSEFLLEIFVVASERPIIIV